MKSKLIHSLQKMVPGPQEQNELAETNESQGQKIAVVDGMVLVQKLYTKSASVNTVKDLSIYFNERLMNITRDYDEIIVAFDTYKEDSLKNKTRQRRQKEKAPVLYQVKDETSIRHITLTKFLSHNQTKSQLTEYLANKILVYNKDSPKLVLTSAAGKTRSNRDIGHLPDNNHEEADT